MESQRQGTADCVLVFRSGEMGCAWVLHWNEPLIQSRFWFRPHSNYPFIFLYIYIYIYINVVYVTDYTNMNECVVV